jgi:hypothetical protein
MPLLFQKVILKKVAQSKKVRTSFVFDLEHYHNSLHIHHALPLPPPHHPYQEDRR